MKKLFLIGAICMLYACTPAHIEVEIHNPSAAARSYETVGINWNDITAKQEKMTPENIVVMSPDRKQIPSQVLYEGNDSPQRLIFQVSLTGAETAVYTLEKGMRQEYPVQAYGRFVPERLDDYAWENNRVAFRVYGPALTDPVTPGIDVWVKSTERMVIDDWYAGADYHTDKGEGMDAYKVGATLGGGASAPFIDSKLWLSGNYETWERLDNGPIRTTVKLKYAPFAVGETPVALEKTISLDANSYFSKMTDVYTGGFSRIPIAAGLVLHEVKEEFTGADYIGIVEAVSDSKDPEKDGDIALGIIMPEAFKAEKAEGHVVIVADVANGIPLEYWNGSGWSRAGVEDGAKWKTLLLQKREQIENPVQVTLK